MTAATGFHCYQTIVTTLHLGKAVQQIFTVERLVSNFFILGINRMHLKNTFCQIQSDSGYNTQLCLLLHVNDHVLFWHIGCCSVGGEYYFGQRMDEQWKFQLST